RSRAKSTVAFAAFQDLLTLLKDRVTNPDGFKQCGVTDFLNAANATVDFALDLARAVVKALFDIVVALLENIDRVLTHSLDIPLVSPLYQQISAYAGQEEDRTILNCSALALAMQFTLLYKTAENSPPFTPDQVQMILSQPFLPPSSDSNRVAGFTNRDVTPLDWGITFAVWSAMVAVTDSSCDYIAAALANVDGKSVSILKAAVKFAGYMNGFGVGASQLMAWNLLPNKSAWDWGQMSDEERWTKGSWIAAWAVPLIDIVWLSVPVLGTLTRAELVGQILVTIAGAANMGVGITAGAMASTVDDRIQNSAIAIFANAASTLTPLLTDFAIDNTEGDSAGFKGWSDAFTDLVAGVLVAASAAPLPLSQEVAPAKA